MNLKSPDFRHNEIVYHILNPVKGLISFIQYDDPDVIRYGILWETGIVSLHKKEELLTQEEQTIKDLEEDE